MIQMRAILKTPDLRMIQMRAILETPDLRMIQMRAISDRAGFRIIRNRINPAGYPKMHDSDPMSSPHPSKTMLPVWWDYKGVIYYELLARKETLEVLPHPPYSPDVAPTDYHLLLSLSDVMQGKTFDD
ncbi:unnamed protein product [Heligmosomoides polygyrus]|uniref:Mariner Mos1 transposase n=1 Tax=Heligmosomoides polygyrus TaxID=6339 RepID=A0A183FYJ1_HELPZ|nr:unnamed protein product [Heligmosomoides polygyrus]